VLQRNISGGTLLLPTLDPPIEVPPGSEIDHDDPLPGFIPVDDAPALAKDAPATDSPAPPGKRKTSTSAATDASTEPGKGATS
jgi:hypothetical protein